jgi:D-alanine-D-alanine ligase
MNVAILAERADDALAAQLSQELRQSGHQVAVVPFDGDVLASLRHGCPEVCLLALSDERAARGDVQELLELLGLPYVGSCSAACYDLRDRAQLPMRFGSIAALSGQEVAVAWPTSLTLSRESFEALGAEAVSQLVGDRIPGGFPVAVKPSRVGIQPTRKVDSATELLQALETVFGAADEALIQQWVEGVKLSVAVLGTGWDAYALPPVELAETPIAPVRWTSLAADEADAQAIRSEIERAALEIHNAFGLEDWSCVEVVWDGAQPHVLGVSAAPSLAEGSLLRCACDAAGLTMAGLLDRLVDQFA